MRRLLTILGKVTVAVLCVAFVIACCVLAYLFAQSGR